ncbi:MAG TPA: hypothetical protein VJM34_00520 [Novosphingobium sp.]|nr:hypothetical protein [Novosphingobium sp.]
MAEFNELAHSAKFRLSSKSWGPDRRLLVCDRTVADVQYRMYDQVMKAITNFVEDMYERFRSDPKEVWSLSISDIRPYCAGDAKAEQAFFNKMGMELAQGYSSGRHSFDFCDGVANGLWVALLEWQGKDPQPPWPDLFYDTYLAFDAGEYQHAGDDEAVDPIKAYTDPHIAWILSNYSTAEQPSPVRRTDGF